MAGGQIDTEGDNQEIAQINIIPFVDISLVLLVIFLLTSSIIARSSFSVDLPRATNAGEAVTSTANIVVTASDEVYLNGAPIASEALGGAIREAVAHEPKLRAVIAADKSLRYEAVIAVIDIVKGAGVSSFALNMQRAP